MEIWESSKVLNELLEVAKPSVTIYGNAIQLLGYREILLDVEMKVMRDMIMILGDASKF